MQHKINLSETTLAMMAADLRDACEYAKSAHTVANICTVLATLIASCGSHGSTNQVDMMFVLEQAGFTPEYYNDGIRVGYFIKQKEKQ